ncbi:MAG: hypothetical protein L7F77_00170 [Candidatus Magnetominusculus sp. LBB02]|nr:hypothetical protein [Candidatus Magnetominusculus sp. LBB02]
MKRIIAAAIAAAALAFILISCGHKTAPTLKDADGVQKKEAQPQRPPDEFNPYSENTDHLRVH